MARQAERGQAAGVVRTVALALLLGSAAAAHAAPPPPAPYPDGLPIEVDGYRMDAIYPAYHSWINRNREEALKEAIRDKSSTGLLTYWDTPFTSEIRSYDFGVVRIDSLVRYCTGRRYDNQPPGQCIDRYKYVLIPGKLYDDASVDRKIATSFRAKELAALMKAAGIAPNGDYWSSRMTSLFAVMTDVKAFWSDGAVVHETDTARCPDLKAAIDKLGPLAVAAAKSDTKSWNFAPHGSHSWIRLSAAMPDGQPVTLEGANALYPLAQPLWDAAEKCAPMAEAN